MENLQYPIGRFSYQPYDETQRQAHIETIRNLPGKWREVAARLTSAQLEQPYRPKGWTPRQVIHPSRRSMAPASFGQESGAVLESEPARRRFYEHR